MPLTPDAYQCYESFVHIRQSAAALLTEPLDIWVGLVTRDALREIPIEILQASLDYASEDKISYEAWCGLCQRLQQDATLPQPLGDWAAQYVS